MLTLKQIENQIGKKIWRDKTSCDCGSCQDVYENGLTIHDKDHASYIFAVQGDCLQEYYLTKELGT